MMDAEAEAEAASLLASLQQAQSTTLCPTDYCAGGGGLYSRFASFLLPLPHSLPPPPTSKTRAQSLQSFFSKALNLLSRVLLDRSPDRRIPQRDTEFLRIYVLILDCQRCLLPYMDGRYQLHLVRSGFVRCLVATGNYRKSEHEADLLLEDLKSDLLLAVQDAQVDLAIVAADIITSLCDSAVNGKSTTPQLYHKIISLVRQVRPWIRSSDSEDCKRSCSRILRQLRKCASFLASECRSFRCDLVSTFCVTVLEEFASCSFHHLILFATDLCPCIDLNCDDGPSIFLDVLKTTLELSIRECKGQFAKGAEKIFGFLSSASDILHDAQPIIFKLAFDNLNPQAEKFDEQPLPVALKLFCKAVLDSHLVKSTDVLNDRLTSIKATISDVYEGMGTMLLLFHERHSTDITGIADITVHTLFEVSLVDDLHSYQSDSSSLVKEWVKVLCKIYNDAGKKDDAPILYDFLEKKMDIKKSSTLGRIIEEELRAYQLLESQFPDLCKIMQEKVIKVLLEVLYSKKDNFLERSRILIAKARLERARGFDSLRGSLDCISEAISLLKYAKSDSCKTRALTDHQLAILYCLHAHCAQENKLGFEIIIEDVNSALDLWLNIDIEHYTCTDGFGLAAIKMVPMLCYLIDLLSIKGYYKHHPRICELIAKTFKRENIPVQRLFCMLCSSRRLGHAICGIQMDVELISDVLQKFHARAHLTEFWANCLEGHKASLSMFAQTLLVNCLNFAGVSEKGFENGLNCQIGIMEIKHIISSLISDPKHRSHSFFIAGYLYYDLSQRFLSEGKLFEASFYAKEALNLREKLQHKKGVNFLKKPYDVHIGASDHSVATETWPDRTDIITDTFLSPWIILRCYLESTFQVGSIYESIGNGVEAEVMFQKGKEISHRELLHSFEITFASSLGQLYRKQKQWAMAEIELRSAQKLLESNPALSCVNCKIFLETTVNLQWGDLLNSRFKNSSLHTSKEALSTYESALKNLDRLNLESSRMEEAETNEQLNFKCKICMLLIQPVQSAVNKRASRNRAHISKENPDSIRPMRVTRSRSGKTSTVTETDRLVTESNNSKRMRKKPSRKTNGDSVSYTRVCWSCLINRALDSGCLTKVLLLAVELQHTKFLLALQLRIARTSGAECAMSGVHKIQSLYWKCIFLLFSRSPGHNSEVHGHQLMEMIADEQQKACSIDRALILYNMGLFLLKRGPSDQYGDQCRTLANFQMQDVVTWLLKAFIFSQESPLLLQKVSRLLASTLVLSTVDRTIALPLHNDKSISLDHWASYFHQVSISTSLDTLYQCSMNKISPKVKAGSKDEASSISSKFIRFPFENIRQLEEHVGCFFESLPDVPIICISMIGGNHSALCKKALEFPSCPAWIMLSKIHSTNQPITMLLPVEEIREAPHALKSCIMTNDIQETKEWQCPWGHSVLDRVAPSFKVLMKENLLSCYQYSWDWRLEINHRLNFLLRNIDESWFGPWICLLRGSPINNQRKELLVSTIINHLKKLTNSEVNPSLVKAIISGSESLEDAKACISQLISYGGSLGHGEFSGKDRFWDFSTCCDLTSEIPEPVMEVLEDAFNGPMPVNREPVIFVLDTHVQMLPWESLPRLRSQEVYRMPSIGSILRTLDINYQRHKDKEWEGLLFSYFYLPKVDPFDTYYLVNPGGDLEATENCLKPWLEGLNFEGKAGVAQTSEELGFILRNYDMFFYFGHGNGTQYISNQTIENLEIRAAVLLMGCSSGILMCKGRYAPQGTPLSYLFAGSPAVIANLWDITDGDIDKFSKALVNSWLQDDEDTPVDCSACALYGNNQKWCRKCGTRRIASSIGKARDACQLTTLIGAAPVCYGVPTVLRRKG